MTMYQEIIIPFLASEKTTQTPKVIRKILLWVYSYPRSGLPEGSQGKTNFDQTGVYYPNSGLRYEALHSMPASHRKGVLRFLLNKEVIAEKDDKFFITPLGKKTVEENYRCRICDKVPIIFEIEGGPGRMTPWNILTLCCECRFPTSYQERYNILYPPEPETQVIDIGKVITRLIQARKDRNENPEVKVFLDGYINALEDLVYYKKFNLTS